MNNYLLSAYCFTFFVLILLLVKTTLDYKTIKNSDKKEKR